MKVDIVRVEHIHVEQMELLVVEVVQQIHVLIYIPRGREVDLLKIKGEVIWVRREEDRSFLVGSTFTRFAPGDERRLRQYLLQHLRGEDPHRAPYFGREGKFD